MRVLLMPESPCRDEISKSHSVVFFTKISSVTKIFNNNLCGTELFVYICMHSDLNETER